MEPAQIIIQDIDQIGGANGGHLIVLELILSDEKKQWVAIPVDAVARLFAKFMSAAHHARDERKASGGDDPLSKQWRHYEVMKGDSITLNVVETQEGERRIVLIVDGAADLRMPFSLSVAGAEKLADGLQSALKLAHSGHIPKPPKPSSHN